MFITSSYEHVEISLHVCQVTLNGCHRGAEKLNLSVEARIIFEPALHCPMLESPDKSLLVTGLQKC